MKRADQVTAAMPASAPQQTVSWVTSIFDEDKGATCYGGPRAEVDTSA
jgi:hypothetical protein